jgi:hypothetical protein
VHTVISREVLLVVVVLDLTRLFFSLGAVLLHCMHVTRNVLIILLCRNFVVLTCVLLYGATRAVSSVLLRLYMY